jgi:hypothetical protein
MIGLIYKIIHNQSNDIYIGSTFDSLKGRFNQHKLNCNNKHYNSRLIIYDLFKEFGVDNFKIILIKQYDVIDKKHLFMYEQLWMNKLNPVNNKNKCFNPLSHKVSGKRVIQYYNDEIKEILKKETKKRYGMNYRLNNDTLKEKKLEYYNENRDNILIKQSEYRKLNIEKIRENDRKKMICNICNKEITVTNKSRHEKSKYHLSLLN